jgi:hypothetical protein
VKSSDAIGVCAGDEALAEFVAAVRRQAVDERD